MPSNCDRPAATEAFAISKSPMVSSALDAWRVAGDLPVREHGLDAARLTTGRGPRARATAVRCMRMACGCRCPSRCVSTLSARTEHRCTPRSFGRGRSGRRGGSVGPGAAVHRDESASPPEALDGPVGALRNPSRSTPAPRFRPRRRDAKRARRAMASGELGLRARGAPSWPLRARWVPRARRARAASRVSRSFVSPVARFTAVRDVGVRDRRHREREKPFPAGAWSIVRTSSATALLRVSSSTTGHRSVPCGAHDDARRDARRRPARAPRRAAREAPRRRQRPRCWARPRRARCPRAAHRRSWSRDRAAGAPCRAPAGSMRAIARTASLRAIRSGSTRAASRSVGTSRACAPARSRAWPRGAPSRSGPASPGCARRCSPPRERDRARRRRATVARVSQPTCVPCSR